MLFWAGVHSAQGPNASRWPAGAPAAPAAVKSVWGGESGEELGGGVEVLGARGWELVVAPTTGSYPWRWIRQPAMGMLNSPVAKWLVVSRGAPLQAMECSWEKRTSIPFLKPAQYDSEKRETFHMPCHA